MSTYGQIKKIGGQPKLDQKIKRIVTTGWLSHFADTFTDALIEDADLISIDRGRTVYAVGEDHLCLYCVVRGSMRFVITMNEQPPRFSHLIGPSTWFGENELALGKAAILEVSAAVDSTLLRINNAQFARVADRHPIAWRAITALSSMNLALAVGSVDDLMIRDTRQRVCAVLLRLSAHRNAFQGQPPMDTLFLTQTELSTATNLSRSMVAKITASLVAAGAIQTTYGGLKILRPEVLKSYLTIK